MEDTPLADDAPTPQRSMLLAGVFGQLFTLIGEGRPVQVVVAFTIGGDPPRIGFQGTVKSCRNLLRLALIELEEREAPSDSSPYDYMSDVSEVIDTSE